MGFIGRRRLERRANFDPTTGYKQPKKRGLFCPWCGSNRLKLFDSMPGLRWYRCQRCGGPMIYDKTDPIRPTSSPLTGKDGKIAPYKPFKQGLIEVHPDLRKLGYKS